MTQWTGCGECDCTFPCHNGEARCIRLQPEPAHGDIRALKYRIHELEGEVIGYKRIIEEAALKKLADLGQEIEQEPVVWMVYTLDGTSVCVTDNPSDFTNKHRALPLYITPPAAQQRKPLTQRQVVDGFCKTPHQVQYVAVFDAGVRFAEAAHGIKEET